jgi:hypothetical protein
MGRLKRANREAVERYEEDGDFLVCRKELTRGEMTKLFRLLPQNASTEGAAPDLEAVSNFMEEFFDIVVRDWSMEDDEGNKILPTREAYIDLEASGGLWVDNKLQGHLSLVMGNKSSDIEGEVTG